MLKMVPLGVSWGPFGGQGPKTLRIMFLGDEKADFEHHVRRIERLTDCLTNCSTVGFGNQL